MNPLRGEECQVYSVQKPCACASTAMHNYWTPQAKHLRSNTQNMHVSVGTGCKGQYKKRVADMFLKNNMVKGGTKAWRMWQTNWLKRESWTSWARSCGAQTTLIWGHKTQTKSYARLWKSEPCRCKLHLPVNRHEVRRTRKVPGVLTSRGAYEW